MEGSLRLLRSLLFLGGILVEEIEYKSSCSLSMYLLASVVALGEVKAERTGAGNPMPLAPLKYNSTSYHSKTPSLKDKISDWSLSKT